MASGAWVILPTYQEAENIQAVVTGTAAALPDATVLVVDDASPDGTAAIARGLGVEVLERPAKLGLGSAYVAGFDRAIAAGADAVFEMDADLSHDPADLPRLLAGLAGADLVLGSRYVPGGGVPNWHGARRLVSRAACVYAQVVLQVQVRDLTGGFKCFRASALETIGFRDVRAHGYAFQVELTYRALRAGLRVQELPITFHERRAGSSKMTGAIALEAAWRIPRLRINDQGFR